MEMVICLAVDCKSDTRQGKDYMFGFPREENLKQQWLIKIKCRNIQSIDTTSQNESSLLRRLKTRREIGAISAGPK